jgi:quercetin dioxygenase-like cupin family protein
VHLVTHPVGQVKEMHVHDPPQDHVITIRSGRMHWTVDGETLDAGPGDNRYTRGHPTQLRSPGQ